MSKRVLIISDVHLRVSSLKRILNEVKHDKVIFLGDFFDSHNSFEISSEPMAQWLKDNINNPNYVFIYGNHDVSYSFPNHAAFKGYGFTLSKFATISKYLKDEDWAKFKFFHVEQGIWCSHAGVDYHTFCNEFQGTITEEYTEKLLEIALEKLKAGGEPFEICDWERSIIWIRHHNLIPLKQIRQIYGHTIAEEVRVEKHGYGSGYNCCLDTNNRHYGIIEDGKLYYASVNDHKLVPVDGGIII